MTGKTSNRDLYLDALRAVALLVVVFGHWLATLPRMDDGLLVGTDHLLKVWSAAGLLTWLVQVVPLFVFVSAAASLPGVEQRRQCDHRQLHWWASRALAMARPALTYVAVVAVLALLSTWTGGRLLGPLNHSLTVHLWFLLMLLTVQALLPLSAAADRRFGLVAVAGLILLAAAVDWLRAGLPGPAGIAELGERVMAADTAGALAVGWINAFVVWLLPQQLGIAWKRGRFRGPLIGMALIALGLLWLAAAVASGYPTGMIGMDLEGRSNMLPPTLALIGVMWLQVGAVLLIEPIARRLLELRSLTRAVGLLSALGMPLYLWHKLAELPAAWLGERLDLAIDAGVPGSAGFWTGRLWWLGLCTLMVVPVIAAVLAFELRRRRVVAGATGTFAIVAGGAALYAGLIISLLLGALPGTLIGSVLVLLASQLLRQRASS
ncbi:MAG: hypothetical protein CVV18_02820 [Gammaproteobacteria bacterium HGW-Gammaproteobacteria-8]|nr:MAG: hypothetical protein CVV18_02820 [Gammaproteobacteria bacterium HGW-Gammaproteobacteria-8]